MKKMTAVLMILSIITATLTGCKSKPKDSDIKAAVETAIQANPIGNETTVSVEKGVVTLNGKVVNEGAKADLAQTTTAVIGVKSVINNLEVVSSPTVPVIVAADDALTAAVKDATKDFPTVQATVSDGIVTLKGEIQKANLQKLMMALQALKPKKVDNSQLVIK